MALNTARSSINATFYDTIGNVVGIYRAFTDQKTFRPEKMQR
jgi:hypothetical protein